MAAEVPHLNILDAWMGFLQRLLMDGEGCIPRPQSDLSRWMLVSLSIEWCEEAEGTIRVQQDIVKDVVSACHGGFMVGGCQVTLQHSTRVMSCHCCQGCLCSHGSPCLQIRSFMRLQYLCTPNICRYAFSADACRSLEINMLGIAKCRGIFLGDDQVCLRSVLTACCQS